MPSVSIHPKSRILARRGISHTGHHWVEIITDDGDVTIHATFLDIRTILEALADPCHDQAIADEARARGNAGEPGFEADADPEQTVAAVAAGFAAGTKLHQGS